MTLVITRPLPDGERTAAELLKRGHSVLLAPLMHVENVDTDLSGPWSGVIVTSANALRSSGKQLGALLRLPLFAVGRRTVEMARDAGFTHIESADGDAQDLIRLVAAKMSGVKGTLLYLAAQDRALDIETALAARFVAVATKIVYRTITMPLPDSLAAALKTGTVTGVLHFSRRSAEAYLAGARVEGLIAPALAPRQFCLSEQVAEPLRAAGAGDIAIAAHPDEAAMLALLGRA